MTEPSKTELELREKIYHLLSVSETIDPNPPYTCLPPGDAIWLSLKATRIANLIKDALPELAKEAGYKSPQECGACKEATNADRKVYESLTPGKFDHLIKKPITGMPQVGQFTPEEYQPILGDIPLELWELAGFPNNLYLTAEGRKTILEDVQRARKAKADWLALPLERKVGLE